MDLNNCKIPDLLSFGNRNNKNWSSIEEAYNHTYLKLTQLDSIINSNSLPLTSGDNDIIVFGSIARNEMTNKSDIDWTLLIDGQVNAGSNLEICRGFNNGLKSLGLKEPGSSGVFGNIAFSHELIHHIGGQEDSNHNLTRRILLLLESYSLSNGLTYDRVISAIINQYIENDSSYRPKNEKNLVPRFLLNDIIRYWRTLCVDFAQKQITQDGDRWAIRNFKLRMSRRLIYLKGILMCFYCYKNQLHKLQATNFLIEASKAKPLEFIYCSLKNLEVKNEYLLDLFNSYNTFLKMINDDNFRNNLEELKIDNAYNDVNFKLAKNISDSFHDAINNILFDRTENEDLMQFVHKYITF